MSDYSKCFVAIVLCLSKVWVVNCYNRDFALQEFWKDCMLLKMKVLVIRLRSPSMSQKQSLHWKILEFPTSPPPKKKSKGGGQMSKSEVSSMLLQLSDIREIICSSFTIYKAFYLQVSECLWQGIHWKRSNLWLNKWTEHRDNILLKWRGSHHTSKCFLFINS